MIVRLGESLPVTVNSGTYSGITINVVIVAAAVNVALLQTDFKPQFVTVKAMKYEKDKTLNVCNDNLQVLGNFSTFYAGRHEFINGYDKKLHAAGANAIKIRAVYIPFTCPLHVDNNEKLIVELTVSSEGTFTSAVNSSLSYFDFVMQPCIGYDFGTPQIISRVIQANAASDSIYMGDNINRILFLNLNQTDLQNEVVASLSLASDKLSYTRTFNQLLAQRVQAFSKHAHEQYGTALPPAGVVRGWDNLPQSFHIYDGVGKGHDLDNVRIDLSFNSTYVTAAQNYIVFALYYPSADKVRKAIHKQQKHRKENVEKKLKVNAA